MICWKLYSLYLTLFIFLYCSKESSISPEDAAVPPISPATLTAVYDTLHGCTILSWSRVNASGLAGYVVYRSDSSSIEPQRLNIKTIKDTFYIDTVFEDLMDSSNHTFSYRLKSIDNNENVSVTYSKPVTISAPSPTLVRTFFSWKTKNTINDSAAVNDTVTFIVSFKNQTRKCKKYSWAVADKNNSVKTVTNSVLSGNDTLKYSWKNPREDKIFIALEDQGNTVWNDSFNISIVKDDPVVDAGDNITGIVNRQIRFTGSASVKFGSIVMYKWNFEGGAGYEDSSSGNPVTAHVFKSVGTYPVKFTARNSRGEEATDSVVVSITRKPLVAIAGSDTTVHSNSKLLLHGQAVQSFGEIKKWEWNIDNSGFIETSSSDTVISIPGIDKKQILIMLRITDENGNNAIDSTVVNIIKKPLVAIAGSDTTVHSNSKLLLHGRAVQPFGEIKKWEWNIDNSGFIETSSSDTVITIPGIDRSQISSVLRITDENGYTAFDSMDIKIGLWDVVGERGFSNGNARFQSLVVYNDMPFVAFSDDFYKYGEKTSVMKFDGIKWVSVGNRGFSNSKSYFQSLASNKGELYVAFCDAENGPNGVNRNNYVMKYTENKWEVVGNTVYETNEAGHISLALNNDTPYVTYTVIGSPSGIIVKKFDGEKWIQVGKSIFYFHSFLGDLEKSECPILSLKINEGIPYLAYSDRERDYSTTVMKYDELKWKIIGWQMGEGHNTSQSLSVDNGAIYVAFTSKYNLRKYRADYFWDIVCNELSMRNNFLSLSVDGGIPYLAFQESSNFMTAAFKLVNNNWTPIGTGYRLSAGEARYQSLAVHDGIPYIAYQDMKEAGGTTVIKYW